MAETEFAEEEDSLLVLPIGIDRYSSIHSTLR